MEMICSLITSINLMYQSVLWYIYTPVSATGSRLDMDNGSLQALTSIRWQSSNYPPSSTTQSWSTASTHASAKQVLGGESSGSAKLSRAVFASLFARTAEEGPRLIVKVASAGRESHGEYMRAGELEAYAPVIRNAEGVKRSEHVWEVLSSKLEGM